MKEISAIVMSVIIVLILIIYFDQILQEVHVKEHEDKIQFELNSLDEICNADKNNINLQLICSIQRDKIKNQFNK